MITIQEALKLGKARLTGSSSPDLDTQVLLGEILRVERAYLLAYPETRLSPKQETLYYQYIQRRAQGEPVAYIIERRDFYDREFIVTSDVLIPRPETEILLEEALKFAQENPGCHVADIGTGSGALAITLAANAPCATVYAIDIYSNALKVARKNAQKHAVNVRFMRGNLAEPLIKAHIKVDLLMANLPYIRSDELAGLDVSRYEPQIALDGGEDGMFFIREVIQQIPPVSNKRGLILLEIAADQGLAVARFINKTLPSCQVTILQDYAGHDRVVRLDLS